MAFQHGEILVQHISLNWLDYKIKQKVVANGNWMNRSLPIYQELHVLPLSKIIKFEIIAKFVYKFSNENLPIFILSLYLSF